MLGPALPHPGTCSLREDGGLTLLAPSPGGLGVGRWLAVWGHRAPQDARCHQQRDVGWGLTSLPSRHEEDGHAQGLQAWVSGVKAKCISSCQPQEEKCEHHLSAGADSVGDCSGLPQRFKMEVV